MYNEFAHNALKILCKKETKNKFYFKVISLYEIITENIMYA